MSRKNKSRFEERTTAYAGHSYYVRPNYIVAVPSYVSNREGNRVAHKNSLANLADNDHKGDVSRKAQMKIRNAVNWLVSSARYKRVFDKKTGKNFFFKINFITLTIPQNEVIPSDKFVKEEVFHPWIQYARKYYGLRNYIWKAEVQKNGMLHFHITTDTFLHHARIRKSWNRLLLKKRLLSDFENKYHHANPNSTDVHSVRKVSDLSAYLAKYLCKKDEGKRKVSGKLWGCNYELSHEKKTVVHCNPEESIEENRGLFRREIEYKPIQSKPDYTGRTLTLAELFFIKKGQWKLLARSRIEEAYNSRRFEIRNNHIPMPFNYFTIN